VSPSIGGLGRTPSSLSSHPSKRRRIETESDAAVRDLMTLPHTFIYSLADLWFKENQQWSPFMSHRAIQRGLEMLPDPIDYVECIELRALLALEIGYSTQAISLGYRGRQRLSQYLRSQVLSEAMSKASMSSIRALLVIALLDYGNDNISSTFSLLSVCRRTCEHLGLFRRLLSQLSTTNPTQVGPPSAASAEEDSSNTLATAWGTLALDAVSTLGVSWRDVSAALVDHLSSVAYISSPDLRDSFRTHVHLAAIGLQPIHTFLHDTLLHPPKTVTEETLARCDEMYTNLMTYLTSQPSGSYTILPTGIVDFDPNNFHTLILSYSSIIMVYAPLITFSSTLATSQPQIAVQRCQQAVSDLVQTIRNISDADAELNTPLLANFLFVAARYKLIMHRQLGTEREPEFDTLMHGINMSGRRWPVARRLDIVLRAAIVELDRIVAGGRVGGAGYSADIDSMRSPPLPNIDGTDGITPVRPTSRLGQENANPSSTEPVATPASSTSPQVASAYNPSLLPPVFWDLRKSQLDISDRMKEWVEARRGDLYIGSLNGPYA
jgi:hypothetical protein